LFFLEQIQLQDIRRIRPRETCADGRPSCALKCFDDFATKKAGTWDNSQLEAEI